MMVSRFIKKNIRYLILIVIIVILIVIFGTTSKNFFSWGTLMNFLRQNAVLFIVSLGMMLTMLTGGLDLSVGAAGSLAAMCAALLMRRLDTQESAWLGILLVIGIGLLIGSINGFFVGYLKISPFMTTLGTQAVAYGATFAISGNNRVIVTNEIYTWLGQTMIPIRMGTTTAKLPVSVFLALLVAVIIWFLIRRCSFGRQVYAVGGNPVAAQCSGINTRFVTFITYVLCSVMMCVASIISVGRTNAATPLLGDGLEFRVLTAVILGGCSLAGGVGTLLGTILGVLLLALINTGLGMVDTPPYVMFWIQGALIIGSVYVESRLSVERRKARAAGARHVAHQEYAHNRERIEHMIAKGEQSILELRHISKSFPGVKALDDVSLTIQRGKVHAVMGENGAGKSTLMKILTGVYAKDEGEILIDGLPVEIKNPTEAQRLGISIIYQEFALVPFMSITQNVYMGKELLGRLKLFLDRKKMRKEARSLLNRFKLSLDVDQKILDCRVAQQQMIEIAKAIGANSWVVVMDEPTGAITEDDKEMLFTIIKELKAQNVAIVYISHRMAEIFEIADEVTVLRDGQCVTTMPVAEVDEGLLIRTMVGRDLSDIFSRERAEQRDVVLEVRDLRRDGVFEPISFQVRAGEVLGFSGLIGAGRTEIMRCLFGLDKADGGDILIDGQKMHIGSTRDAIRARICMVSEDRRGEGIVPPMSVRENITIPSLPALSRGGVVDRTKEKQLALDYIERLDIKTPTPEQLIKNLSGGNQQKVCVAKWLALNPRVIILDEPTRGIDVGAKAEIHKLIEQLAKAGMAVILISSELPEIIGSCDRIIVLYEGKKTGEFMVDDALTQEVIMASAAGVA